MKKIYNVRLESPMSDSFYGVRAANSLDIDVKKKSLHELTIEADVESDFRVGLIVGASGSGKSTLMRHIWGQEKTYLDKTKAVIDQFPEGMAYDERAASLCGIGLSSVPCWLKPAGALSNGQQARAEAALAMAHGSGTIVIDEWTSVVDRTVAKVMSHCVAKYARKSGKQIVLVACHYDIIEWLDPDWIIDCNSATYTDRRSLRPEERARRERLCLDVREVTRNAWSRFAKYHYLGERMPGSKSFYYGLFLGEEMIGFNAAANYVPWSDKSKPMILHVTRTVIHPDFVGFGLGMKLDTAAAEIVSKKGFRVMAKFSSEPFYIMMRRHPAWRLLKVDRQIGRMKFGKTLGRAQKGRGDAGKSGFRENVKTYTFEYVPQSK